MTISKRTFLGKVLVVDDDGEIRALMKQRLERFGVEVVEAKDYVTAVNAVNNDVVDLIICDFNIVHGGRRGHKHGGHFAEWLRSEQKNEEKQIPFYFVSGLFAMVEPEKQKRYLNYANGFIEKPITISQIQNILESHLGSVNSA